MNIVRLSATYDEPFDQPPAPRLTSVDILERVARATGVSIADIIGRDRTHRISHARHAFFYGCLQSTAISAADLAFRYGFHHASVLYGAAAHARRTGLENVTEYSIEAHRRRARRTSLKTSRIKQMAGAANDT